MKKKKITLERVFICITLIAAALICLLLSWQNLKNIDINSAAAIILDISVLIIFAAVAFVFVRFNAFIEDKYKMFLTVVMILSLAVRVIYIIAVRTPPSSDFGATYNAAQQILQGSQGAFGDSYFQAFPYMIPFALFEAVILAIFNEIYFLKAVMIAFMVGSNLLVYMIAKKLTNRACGIFAALVYACLPEIVLISSVLSNQHPASFFFLLGFYLLISADSKHSKYILAGVSLAVSNLFRPEVITLFAAIAACTIIAVFKLIDTKNSKKASSVRKQRIKHYITAALCLFGVYFLINAGASAALTAANISESGLSSKYTHWKYICGLNPDTRGAYSSKHVYYMHISDPAERKAEGDRIIADNLSKIEDMGVVSFFIDKSEVFWRGKIGFGFATCDMDMDRVVLPNTTVRDVYAYAEAVSIAVSVLLWLSAAVGLVLMYKQREMSLKRILVPMLFLATYAAYSMIEIQVRYRYNIIAFTAIMSAFCADRIVRELTADKTAAVHNAVHARES